MKLRILLISLATLLAVPTAIVRAQSAVVDDQTPAQRCGLAQNYLKNIQKPRDLHARVDRLQAYRYIQQRLEVFVVRLEKNNQPGAEELRTQLTQLERGSEAFKNHYEAYDQAREAIVNVSDCSRNITAFQEKLNQARAARQKVHDDVVRIQNLYDPEVLGQLTTLKQQMGLKEEAE